jgi:Gpi18-like mannosyltransferase
MGAIYLAAVFLSKRNISREATFFILFNIAYLYNTMVWGQADSIHTTLVFASFIFCFRGNAVLSWILFLLAVNMKLQAIVFFPHLLFLSALFVKNKRDVLAGFGLAALTQIAILLPFILEGTLNEVLKNTSELIGYFPVTSQGAFNIWHLLLDKDPITVPDHNVFLGMTYRTWGLLLFFLFSAFFLLPVFRVLARSGQQSGIHSIGIFFLSCSLTALFFFYFNTEMHERYVHPAILFAGLHAIIFRSYPYYILLSAAYTLNLEKIMLKYLSVNHNTLIFDRQFIALVFALAMLTGMYEIIRQLRAFRNTHTAISASAQEQNNYPQTYSA